MGELLTPPYGDLYKHRRQPSAEPKRSRNGIEVEGEKKKYKEIQRRRSAGSWLSVFTASLCDKSTRKS